MSFLSRLWAMDIDVVTFFFGSSIRVNRGSRSVLGGASRYALDVRLVLGTAVDSDNACFDGTRLRRMVLVDLWTCVLSA